MKKFLIACVLLFAPLNVEAQVQPTEYDFVISGAASSTYTFPAANVTCNLTALPGTATNINPRYIVWDDVIAGRFCMNDTGANAGPLFALPIGDYSAYLQGIVATPTNRSAGPTSNTVSFSRLVPPAARTGLRVRGVS